MSSNADAIVPSVRRARKSTGQSPVRKRMDKENITVDVASSLAGNGSRKKLRSKSMGPGGLDALKPGTGNRRVSLAAPARPPPKSILKPTIPTLPEIPPHKPKSRRVVSSQSTENLINTFGSAFGNDDLGSSGTRIALRTEEEQQAAARKRETDERSVLEKETKDRREARRKSLANRRVSFAAEATLHTFHEVEFMQESTTSTDSTRRASSSTAQLSPQTQGPTPSSLENTDPPSTPPPGQENLVPETPEHQGDLHQKKRRRSSTGSTLNFHGRDDDTLSSTVYSSDSDGTDDVIETHEEIHSDSGSDSDDDGTTMDLDLDEMTGTSIASGRSNWTERSMDSDNDTLDGALRLAQRQAQTQSIDEEEEIIPSFGWAKKPAPIQRDLLQVRPLQGQPVTSRVSEQDIDQSDDGGGDMDMDMDMDMTHAIGGIIKSTVPGDDLLGGEMSMDVTKVLGGIISQQAAHLRQQSLTPDQDNEGSAMEDATMEMTMALGGIRQAQPLNNDLIELESNADYEDMSMELTTVIDGALASKQTPPSRRKSSANRRRTMLDDGSPMDMTVGLGRILMAAQIEEFADNEDEATMGMDMPTAIGEIIEYPFLPESRGLAKQAMEEEANQTDATPVAANSPSKRRLSALVNTGATPETGSPGLSAFRGKSLRHSTNQKSKPSSPIRTSSPVRSSSPFKELTPKSKPPSSPLKTPPGRRSPSRSLSPQRSAILESATPRSAPRSLLRTGLFQQDPSTGISTPRHVLTPQARRLSGLGIDRPGLGSPKVAQIMDRRGSIGEAAVDFVPGKIGRGVSFADPRIIADEVDQERREDEDRESSRRILEREANGDDDNTTATLKDMISSMSPKKNKSVPLRGRKSLHVGSAMGLLGKRPTELDSDDDRDDSAVIKRLKGLQNSPVKNIRLNAPPSKAETTGRTLRSSERVLEEIGGNVGTPAMALSPKKANAASSPQATDRFKHVGDQPTITFSFEEPHRVTEFNIQDDDGEHIHLQDFLNMTSIRFMELTTTKRRHTQAPTGLQDSTLHEDGDVSLERCVVAGACTVPMLELYQHSCRELKKYISEGRRIIREIETETFEENPPLFKEYIAASPDFKMLMDNQFKNVKTHARLLSKAMWYEWRMKLQDGLKEGLVKIAEGMNDDEQLLQREEELLQSTLPELIKQFEALEVEGENLQAIAQEIADCDPEDLQNARAELVDVDADIEAKMHQIEELQSSLKETESATEEFTRRKQNCIASIEEAEQVREECRGWTPNEINALKEKVDRIEKEHGWNITGNTGTTISMTFRREIELVFDVASFQSRDSTQQSHTSNSRIDLWYVAANRERDPQPSTPEREFFIQAIRDYVRTLDQTNTKISTLLRRVATAWNKAGAVADDVRVLNSTFPTNATRTGDSSIAINVALLLAPLQTKVQLSLDLRANPTPAGLQIALMPQAKVVYGEHFKVDNVCEYLSTRMGGEILSVDDHAEGESWSDIVVELHERLLARGQK